MLERAEALDRTFEREYPSFQLCCHGLMALRQALRHRTAPKNTLDPVGEAKKCTPARKEFSSATASDPEDPQIWAETYLLRTRGAKLADLITAGECSKLVRTIDVSENAIEGSLLISRTLLADGFCHVGRPTCTQSEAPTSLATQDPDVK